LAQPDISLWLPGLGETDLRVRKVAHAVRDYDESLRLAKNENFGDWCVVIGEMGHPVLSLGMELPDPRDVAQMLAKHDTKRYGKQIMEALARESERKRLDEEYRYGQTTGAVAEVMESAMHRLGGTPYKRSLRKVDPKHRGQS